MDISQLIQAFGLLLDALGVLIMFLNSPANIGGTIYIYNKSETEQQDITANKKNSKVRLGLIILLAGFLLQLVGLIYPCITQAIFT